jgi:threonine dehydratase
MSLVTWDDVANARARIAPFAHRTPVLTSATIDRMSGARVLFKCENLQTTGSFKFRGATNAVASLTARERARGVYAHSSGNHAQALALAARLHRVPAYLVMPEDAPEIKRRAVADYGGRITRCPPTHRGRVETAERIAEETGARFVSAHDDPQVIAGQGTALCELIEDAGELDLILAPVGGGGLLSGTVIAARHLSPGVRVVGCEPAGADDAYRSIREGRRITDFTPRTIADGLRTPLGENTFEILRAHLDGIVLVSEAQILAAMRTVWERMKIVIEPSSAVAVAPLLERKVHAEGKRVGVILSGGNVDLSAFFTDLANDVPAIA